jgi:xylose isomerase
MEFFHVLRQNDWNGVWQLDQFPFREDSVEAANLAIDFLKRIDAALNRLDVAALDEAQERQDAVAANRIVQDALYG